MSDEKVFTSGMVFRMPKENWPDFVKGRLSIKLADFIPWLEAHVNNNGWVDIDIKLSQSGKIYGQLSTFKKEQPPLSEELAEDVPF